MKAMVRKGLRNHNLTIPIVHWSHSTGRVDMLDSDYLHEEFEVEQPAILDGEFYNTICKMSHGTVFMCQSIDLDFFD